MILSETVWLAETLDRLSPDRRAGIVAAIRAADKADRRDRFATASRAAVQRYRDRQAQSVPV